LVVKLDVTKPADTEAAVKAAVDRFGRIDVLVNNAASFFAGYFEELTPAQIDLQLDTSLVGPMNVTRPVLPVMRKQRAGQIITISSSAGLSGFEFGTAYAASKFGLEGWMESLQAEVSPFGIQTMIVNPGFFRTLLLTEKSTNYAAPSVEEYSERRAQQLRFWNSLAIEAEELADCWEAAAIEHVPLQPKTKLQRFLADYCEIREEMIDIVDDAIERAAFRRSS
jgi:NAD(P)-dependent dehydrogenase (short-subunit alcohol dehydrogenase family)